MRREPDLAASPGITRSAVGKGEQVEERVDAGALLLGRHLLWLLVGPVRTCGAQCKSCLNITPACRDWLRTVSAATLSGASRVPGPG